MSDFYDPNQENNFHEPQNEQDVQVKARVRQGNTLAIVLLLVITLMFNVILTTAICKSILGTKGSGTTLQGGSDTYYINYELGTTNETVAEAVAKANMGSTLEIVCSNTLAGSAGTGVVITDDGYVLTNAHVILTTATRFNPVQTVYSNIVAYFNGEQTAYMMKVIAYDTTKDLALLQFESTPEGLVPVIFADSDALRFGEIAVAIGNAEGLGLSVTEGIVSNPSQDRTSNDYAYVIQTTASLNSGNSGGPLFNQFGQLIGINTFKITDTESMGFAIPTVEVKDFIARAEEKMNVTVSYGNAE